VRGLDEMKAALAETVSMLWPSVCGLGAGGLQRGMFSSV